VNINEVIHSSSRYTRTAPSLECFSTSALHWLCNGNLSQYSKYISYLLENDADPNLRNMKGRTPLHIVCSSKERIESSVEIIELLVNASADVNAQDENECTALHIACSQKLLLYKMNQIETLLELRADCNIEQHLPYLPPQTALSYLLNSRTSHTEQHTRKYIRLLIDSGCKIWPRRYSMYGRNEVGEALLRNAYTRDKVKNLLEKTQFIDGMTLFELVHPSDFLDFLFLRKDKVQESLALIDRTPNLLPPTR